MVQAGRLTNADIIRRMPLALWISKARDTPSQYVIPIAFPQQQCYAIHYVHSVCCWLSESRRGGSTGGILCLQRGTSGHITRASSTLTKHCPDYDLDWRYFMITLLWEGEVFTVSGQDACRQTSELLAELTVDPTTHVISDCQRSIWLEVQTGPFYLMQWALRYTRRNYNKRIDTSTTEKHTGQIRITRN
jgi:hypothetical protein